MVITPRYIFDHTAAGRHVASALRYLAKQVMTGNVSGIHDTSARAAEVLQGQIATKGIGEPIISKFLAEVPGVNENTVRDHLAILKASGDYGGSSASCRCGNGYRNFKVCKGCENRTSYFS
jgi:hypothetical protein